MDKIMEKVLVAMSGGVDSSVSALLLKQQGYDVQGAYFVLQRAKNDSAKVRKIAKKIGIKLHVVSLTDQFKKEVVDCFIRDYHSNRTPNPCVLCNPKVKFVALQQMAEKLDIPMVATGHYACIKRSGKQFELTKAKDQSKDQSYFLYRLSQKQLGRTIFPLCKLQKAQVKRIAARHGMPVQAKESQDICFVNKGESLAEFLGKYYPQQSGAIVDERGNLLGLHESYMMLTIGQRQGLRLGGHGPYYVIGKNRRTNMVMVTTDRLHRQLWSDEIIFTKPSWIGNTPSTKEKYQIKTRYQARSSTGTIIKRGRLWIAKLQSPQWAVTVGQSLVAYSGDQVLGGGIISKVMRRRIGAHEPFHL